MENEDKTPDESEVEVSAENESEQTSVEELITRVDFAEARARELEQEVVRNHAEMDNLRKRMAREMEQARKYATEKLISELLPACDSLERGLEFAEGKAPGVEQREGMELTLKMLLKALEKHGLSTIVPVGQPFNPEWHEAMAMQPPGEHPPGTVIQVLQKGYSLNERLVRPALVVVAQDQ